MTAQAAPRLERHHGAVDLLALAASQDGFAQLLTVRGWRIALFDPLRVVTDLPALAGAGDALRTAPPAPPGAPPFTGGLAGFLSDEPVAAMLGLNPRDGRPPVAPLPPLAFGLYDTAVCQAPDGSVWLAAVDVPGESTAPAASRLERLRALVSEPPRPRDDETPGQGRVASTLDADAHASAVRTVRDWIAAGDLYQLNLTTHFTAPWAHGGAALARRLWTATPGAPHAAWLRAPGGAEIVSASPETFLRVDGRRATIRPIKGTRPRGRDAEADRAERLALERSAKDHAEHVMIVDLERNDLGRVAVPGSVTVAELAATEAHPTVWHLTSTVTAELRADVGLGELLAATYPCGSVTGAPKRMAVDRIRALEPVRRGVYCGAIGVIGPGMVDLSVAIRTAVVHDDRAHYGAGGGIVADSDPAQEWQEVLHKAEAFFSAVNGRPG